MSHRIRRTHDEAQLAPLPARAADLTSGVSTEMSDRRSISIFAMFAIDEPEDPRIASSIDDGICAFLPTACTETWERSRG